MVYLDYAANSPVDSEVLDLFYETTKKYYANPNSNHKLGQEAKNLIDKATANIAANLRVSTNEIVYTSGATESNNLAVKGSCEKYKNFGKHIIVSALEHTSLIASATAMQELGFDVDVLRVQSDGIVDLANLKELLRDDTILVSVCSVDSELGIKQPIEEIAKIVHEKAHAIFHTDASQAIGKVDIDFENVDLVTIAPHKFYGLTGSGILIKKDNITLKPMMSGGKSTTLYRSGTPEVANIVALDKALDKAIKLQKERYKYVLDLNKKIKKFLSGYDAVHINSTDKSIPFTINFSIKNIKSDVFAALLEKKDIILSTKTSCCPKGTPSKLVYALTGNKALASTSLRLSLSHMTTKEDIMQFFRAFDECLKEINHGKISRN